MPPTYPIRPLKTPAPASKRPKAGTKAVAITKAAPVTRLSTRDGKGGDGVVCVQNIVNNDRQTHVYLVQALYFRERARQAGRNDPALSAALDKTLASYAERQQRLRTSKLLKTQATLSQWAKTWTDKLKAVVSGPGAAVGVLPLIPIAVGVVAIIGTATACWLLFHNDEPKSAADVMTAYHASEAYGSMTPEQQTASDQALQQASQGGYQDGKDAADSSLFGQLKTVALVLGGSYLVTQMMGNRKRG